MDPCATWRKLLGVSAIHVGHVAIVLVGDLFVRPVDQSGTTGRYATELFVLALQELAQPAAIRPYDEDLVLLRLPLGPLVCHLGNAGARRNVTSLSGGCLFRLGCRLHRGGKRLRYLLVCHLGNVSPRRNVTSLSGGGLFRLGCGLHRGGKRLRRLLPTSARRKGKQHSGDEQRE